MKIRYLPKSRLGVWSAGSITFTIFVFLLWYILGGLLHNATSGLFIAITGAGAVIASIAAVVTGLVAMIRKKDRSTLVILSVVLGVVVVLLVSFIILIIKALSGLG